MSKFIAVDEALNHILSRIPTTGAERLAVGSCRGRRLAEPVDAPWDSPRFDNSAMDGFAVRYDDVDDPPATLELGGSSAAGDPSSQRVESGQAFRIFTGAALPEGADTVVRQERCSVDGQTVTVEKPPKGGHGANIRRAATYLEAGQPALQPGTRLGGAEVGLLASFGRPVVPVHTRPTVGVISTGDELVELGEDPGPGQIVNSNSYMLETLVQDHGGVPRVYPTAPDDRDRIEEVYRRAVDECDLVVSTGGVSVGEHDHVHDVVDDLTGGMTFWKVRMKPGKPLVFGLAGPDRSPVPLIGLPGNPGSGFVCYQIFVRPALAVFQGVEPERAELPRVEATLRGTARGSSGRRAYLAGRAEPTGDGLVFEARDHQSSGNPALFAAVNALGIVEREIDELEDGEAIPVHLLEA